MVDESTSEDNITTNKGVNVCSDSCPAVHKYLESDSSISSVQVENRSLTDIKNQIQNVLDLMGPTTPTLYNTSSDADNEDSVLSMVPTKSKERSISSERKTTCTSSTYENMDSVLADHGTLSSSNNFESLHDMEYPCYNSVMPHLCLNPNCMCMIKCMNQASIPIVTSGTCAGCHPTPNKSTTTTNIECKKRGIMEWLKNKPFDLMLKKSSANPCGCDLYKINISGQEVDGGAPRRVVFDLVDGIPKPTSSTVATNTIRNPIERRKTTSLNTSKTARQIQRLKQSDLKNGENEKNLHGKIIRQSQQHIYNDTEGNTRVDFYYFDHGNSQYFHTTDTPAVMTCEILAEKTEKYTTKFWAEFFATIHIAFSFCISFILQLYKFLLYSIIRPLTVGLMQLSSDYFFKPFLTTLFNGIIQPYLIFLYNIATSIRDLCDPVAEGLGYFFKEVAVLFRAIRLCSYKRNVNNNTEEACDCTKKCEC